MLLSTKALVIHTFPYSDSSLMVKAYTEKLGYTTFLLKGFKRNRKQKINLHPLALIEVTCFVKEGSGLNHARNVSLLRPYSNILTNPLKSGMAMFLAEFLGHAIKDDHEGEVSFFTWLTQAVDHLERKDSLANFHLWFLLSLSEQLGFLPQGKRSNETPLFSIIEGSFLTKGNAATRCSEKESILLDKLMENEMDELLFLPFNREERMLLLNLLHAYFQVHLDKEFSLKSLDVLRQLYKN